MYQSDISSQNRIHESSHSVYVSKILNKIQAAQIAPGSSEFNPELECGTILADQKPDLESWKLAIAIFLSANSQVSNSKSYNQGKIFQQILNDSDKFFELYLQGFYPFLNYLKNKAGADYALTFIQKIRNQYAGNYDETVYPLKRIIRVIAEKLRERKMIQITVDFDDTLHLFGVPNFGLINIISKLQKSGIAWEIVTSRLQADVPQIEKFIQENIPGYVPRITFSKEADFEKRSLGKWSNLLKISQKYDYVIHVDDLDAPHTAPFKPVRDDKVLWGKIPYFDDSDIEEIEEFYRDFKVNNNYEFAGYI